MLSIEINVNVNAPSYLGVSHTRARYIIMINNSNPKKWVFFANDKHFLAMIRRAKKLTTNIGSYLPDFAIKTCTEAASVHASVHHYDK